ncbi:MAG: glycosyltransferase family 2 protein [Candidatus Acididesulfobacter diazotrophicus]|uniref:Glycosyltransferase family 2 protein n=1 Tax=Candidatus Acididesulfobacter diazotrophicus TaxID=2597226 RepID=A0A519BKH5_9DELT|nr:MAG: glycosyltransferase family 2 protein [Candidatus Acididesulfobacter diazotrophicus]
MLISKNRFKKIWYYLKKGRINVFFNIFRLSLLNRLNGNYKSIVKKIEKKPLIFPELNNSNFSGEVSVSIIIPVYNQWDYTYLCLKSILKNTKVISYEVIIADDNSSDETVNIEKYVKNVKIIRNKNNLGFLRNCNNAAKHASGKYILFLNNDTEVQKVWLKNLLQLMESDDKIGIAGPKFIYPNGVLLEAGCIIWKDGESWQYGMFDNPDRPEYNYSRETDFISGACIIIKKELFYEIGGFDERYAPAYYEDADLAFEVRKRGYKVVYLPSSVVIHYENITYKKYKPDDGQVNKEKFIQKWKKKLENEHYEHMNNINKILCKQKSQF